MRFSVTTGAAGTGLDPAGLAGLAALAERLDEGLTILAGLWGGREVHHEGTHYRVDGLRLAATPVQRPRIPICDVRGVLALVAQERGNTEGFDVKVSGSDDPAKIAALAEAGATWWGRWVEPGDAGRVREIILRGPPRI